MIPIKTVAAVAGMVATLLALSNTTVQAVGPKRPVAPAEPADRQAFPIRFLELGQVSASSFQLPGGTAVDMNVNLRETVDSKINQSEKFRTYQREAPVARHGIIDVAITALELDVVTAGIKLGYKPGGGDIGNGQGLELNGEATVNVGSISMSFTIYDSISGETYSSVIADKSTVGFNLSFKVNFDRNFSIGPELQIRDRLSSAIGAMATNGMVNLASRPRTNLLPWSARVRGVDTLRKLVLFDAGVRAGVGAGSLFRVYSSCQVEGCLETYVGDLKVRKVLEGDVDGSTPNGYSEASLKDDPQGTALNVVKIGDKVYIQYLQ